MSQQDPLNPVLDKLGRFTPVPAVFDRDELFFQAGRASVRASLGWKMAAGLLLATQLATLGWLFQEKSGSPGIAPREKLASPSLENPRKTAINSSSYGSFRQLDIDALPIPVSPDPSGDKDEVLTPGDVAHLLTIG